MSRFIFPIDALPSDVFELLVSCLHGFDLLRLSHVNQRLLNDLLAPYASEWQRRVSHERDAKTAKERYFASSSVQFTGREGGPSTRHERGGAVKLWQYGVPRYWTRDSFSLDLSFALMPAETGVHFGGIILGAQSVEWNDNWWAHYHQQFILVDTQGNLYCTVVDEKIVVAKHLEAQWWYHLVLTFDRSTDVPTQRVYLEGKLIHSTTGSLHHESYHLDYAQLGTGCISGGSQGQPTDDFCGWYGFHGVLDGCRLWRGVLQPEQVHRIAHGQTLGVHETLPTVEWTMESSDVELVGLASRVQCTRPLERFCSVMRRLPVEKLDGDRSGNDDNDGDEEGEGDDDGVDNVDDSTGSKRVRLW